MAINPSTRYPGQVDVSDPIGYPYGKAKNIVAPDDGTGTPWEADVPSDTWGFYQALLDDVGDTPSGTPDKVGASQYLDAINAKIAPKAIAPATSTDNSVPRMDGTDSKALQSSGVLISDASEIVYATPPTRVITVPLPTMLNGFVRSNNDNVQSSAGGDVCSFDLSFLPDGATLTQVRFMVVQAGAPVVNLGVGTRTRDFSTPAQGTYANIATGASTGTGLNVVALSALGASVSKSTGKSIVAWVEAGSAVDYSYGIEVTFTDPGPRNF